MVSECRERVVHERQLNTTIFASPLVDEADFFVPRAVSSTNTTEYTMRIVFSFGRALVLVFEFNK